MAKACCLIVRASGRKLDELRSAASTIAQEGKIDWWVERTDKGTCFFFGDEDAKKRFVLSCENLGVSHQDG